MCFFAADLFRNKANFRATTVRNYVGHIRSLWARSGAALSPFDQTVLNRILRGVRALRPNTSDSRVAFLLPHYRLPRIFLNPCSKDHLIFKAAVILGFFGMFRFSTFEKLNAQAIILVDRQGREIQLTTECQNLLYSPQLAGFYLNFSSKCHANARAYYCTLKHLPTTWRTLCPLTILQHLAKNNMLFHAEIFPRKRLSSKALGSYMTYLARSSTPFTPHSLRIGGHTFFSVHNMNEDFVQFLGRRTITRASQLYYRARALDNIIRLEIFFGRLSSLPAIYEVGVFGQHK